MGRRVQSSEFRVQRGEKGGRTFPVCVRRRTGRLSAISISGTRNWKITNKILEPASSIEKPASRNQHRETRNRLSQSRQERKEMKKQEIGKLANRVDEGASQWASPPRPSSNRVYRFPVDGSPADFTVWAVEVQGHFVWTEGRPIQVS